MAKKQSLVGLRDVRYLFQSSLILFFIIGAIATIAFYLNVQQKVETNPVYVNFEVKAGDDNPVNSIVHKAKVETPVNTEEKEEVPVNIVKQEEVPVNIVEKEEVPVNTVEKEETPVKGEEEEDEEEGEEVLVNGEGKEETPVKGEEEEDEEEKGEEEEPVNGEKKEETPGIVEEVKKYDTGVYDSLNGCDVFDGKWVYDDQYYPLYNASECPYVLGDFACDQYGRKDTKYQHWRWQPKGCNIPRFDPKEVLERLRGKKVMFIGDSVMRNQWISMLCMLQSVIPKEQQRREKIPDASLLTFKALEYNASIDFYWSPLILESNADHPQKHRILDRMVRLDSIEHHAKWWNADSLVFNSYLWWKLPTMKILLNGSFGDDNQVFKVVDKHRAYQMALEKWSNWVHTKIKNTKTKVHYMGMTATHFGGHEWGSGRHENCYGETEPITKEGFWEGGSDRTMFKTLETTIQKLKNKGLNVNFINISQLTQYRKDAHPSIYRLFYSPLTKKQLSNPSSYADCSHWCLPGAPDVWNELLLTYVLRNTEEKVDTPMNSEEKEQTLVNTEDKENTPTNTEKKEEVSVNSEGKVDEKEKNEAPVNVEKKEETPGLIEEGKKYDTAVYDSLNGCDIFAGKWVYDEKSHPLYNATDCPYILGDYACDEHGRKDTRYQHWRWQPHGCNIPRFDPKEVLERLRGKKVMFIGDSVMRNQWISMVCMLQSVIPSGLKRMEKIPDVSLLTFKAIEYDASVDFYWAPLILESNADHPQKHRILDRIVRLDSIEHHAKYWNADSLVFNSYLWWKLPTMKIMLNGSFEDENQVYKVVDKRRAYQMALKKWSNWVQTHINVTRTKVHYMGMTATHFRGDDWGSPNHGNCYGETEPVTTEGFWEYGSDRVMFKTVERTIRKLKEKGVNANLINISQLTQYRKDAHPSIYRLFYSPLTKEQLSNPSSYADCSHWCLPGAPDVWNELLLTYVLRNAEEKVQTPMIAEEKDDASTNAEEKGVALANVVEKKELEEVKHYDTAVYDSLNGCDLFSGKWVYDEKFYPLYNASDCPYIYGDFACDEYGRQDTKYQHWRWQPHGCNIPRFDAKEVLERLRGKKVMFVGDSVNRNQWVSMVCMLQSVIPLGLKKMEKVPGVSLLTFKAIEYDVTIDFYWAPLLIESNGDHPTKHRTKDRIVKMDTIEKHANNWLQADSLVFNSYLWWRLPTVKILPTNGSFEDPDHDFKIVDNRRGYRMALKKWSSWLEKHINTTKTKMHFMSMTATHHHGLDWGLTGEGDNCLNETEPITQEGFWESGSDRTMLRSLEATLSKLKTRGVNVKMINITQLTQYRKDAHPGIHRLHYSPLTKEQLAKPSSYADCTHWCLPGAPDMWNELLLTYILRNAEEKVETPVIVEEKDEANENADEKKETISLNTKVEGENSVNVEEERGTPAASDHEQVKHYDTSVYDSLNGCDLFSGKWVFDDESYKTYPLYDGLQCPYIYGDYACDSYGRKDTKYKHWRWQPHGCNLPRFDAKEVLERLRGKRVMFVGDSVNKNQWISMICMLQSAIPDGLKKMEKVPGVSLMRFKAIEYNASVDFYWDPCLVESNGDHSTKTKNKKAERVVRTDAIESHGRHWVDADVLVFNSYLWWRLPTVKILKSGSFEDSEDFEILDNRRGYFRALRTWSSWLQKNINTTKTKVHFMSMTATHHSGPEWGKRRDENCYKEMEPITEEGFWERTTDGKMLGSVEYTINQLKEKGVNVQLMNITQLSQYRKDAHPSIYRMQHAPLTKKQLSNPSSYSDCTHWCLPGAPDVWNELLLTYILRS